MAIDAANPADAKSATPVSETKARSADAHGDQADHGNGGPDAAIAAAAVSQVPAADLSQASAAAVSQVPTAAVSQAPAAAMSQAQPTANRSQPVAAAISVNAAAAAASVPASGTAFSESTGARAKVSLAVGDDQGALPTQTKDGAPAEQPPSANKTDGVNNIESGAPGDTANTLAPSGSFPWQAWGPTGNDAAMLAQTDASAPTDSNHATSRADALSAPFDAAGLSGAQTASGAAKTDGLPNFGFSAANTATPLAAAATPGSAAAAAVPVAGLAVAITARAQTGSNQFDIRLDPPELGRIDVRLHVDRNGQVTSHITADRADTLQLLQSQQPQLERALEQAGLKTADNGLQFALRDQSFAGQNGSNGGQQYAAQLVIPEAELAPVESTQIYSRLSLGSGIDIRV